MTKNQLRNDLCKRINERYEQWHKDSMDLYQMAGLRAHHFAQDVFVLLITEMVSYCYRFDLDPDEIADSLKVALRACALRETRQ